VYIDGKPASKLRNEHLVDDLEALIREKIRLKQQQQDALITKSV
ncbi:4-hydroxy-3-methylbut-2-en-1-yl diphosphate synthase, partial [Halomonas sp. 707D4]|nr:4-hydroxy-3-methylbut-2-en-1-yl diphosphate synthase [Halomonas sp. 707D4]